MGDRALEAGAESSIGRLNSGLSSAACLMSGMFSLLFIPSFGPDFPNRRGPA